LHYPAHALTAAYYYYYDSLHRLYWAGECINPILRSDPHLQEKRSEGVVVWKMQMETEKTEMGVRAAGAAAADGTGAGWLWLEEKQNPRCASKEREERTRHATATEWGSGEGGQVFFYKAFRREFRVSQLSNVAEIS